MKPLLLFSDRSSSKLWCELNQTANTIKKILASLDICTPLLIGRSQPGHMCMWKTEWCTDLSLSISIFQLILDSALIWPPRAPGWWVISYLELAYMQQYSIQEHHDRNVPNHNYELTTTLRMKLNSTWMACIASQLPKSKGKRTFC